MGLVVGPPEGPPLPRSLLHSEARAAGITRGQLANRRKYLRPARTLYTPAGGGGTLLARCLALSRVLPDDAVFSHDTAAALYKVGVPDEPQVHICTESPIEPRIKGLVGHRIKTIGEVYTLHGLRVTSPGRTFLDLASRLGQVELLVAGDGLARRDSKGVAGLREAVLAGVGRRGVKQARLVLPLIDPGSKSPQESRLRFLVVTDGLGAPLVNQPVRDAVGEWIAEPDLQFPEFKVAIEYEGDHHRERRQWERDIRRDENLAANGWIVIKVTSTDLHVRPAATLARIREALLSRGWRP